MASGAFSLSHSVRSHGRASWQLGRRCLSRFSSSQCALGLTIDSRPNQADLVELSKGGLSSRKDLIKQKASTFATKTYQLQSEITLYWDLSGLISEWQPCQSVSIGNNVKEGGVNQEVATKRYREAARR